MSARYRKAMSERDRGFTLIELLVVIIIIGILAAIAIPVFLNQRKKGVDASMKADLKSAANAAETFSTDYPSSAAFTIASPATTTVQVFTNNGFQRSPGNTVSVAGGPAGGYCLRVINAGSSTPASYLSFDSRAGGLQVGFSAAGTCSLASPTWTQIHA